MPIYSNTSKRFFVKNLMDFKGRMGRIKNKKIVKHCLFKKTTRNSYVVQVHPCGRYRHNTVVFILAKDYGLKNLRTIHRLDR
jgi:hypothetical protein